MRSRAYHVRYRELPYGLMKYYIIYINALTRISRSLSRTALWSYEILYYLHQCAVAHITFAIANCLMFLLNIILFTSMRSRTYHVRYRELPYGLMKYYIIYINALTHISRSLSRTALWSYEILYYLHQCAHAHITFAIANCLMVL